MGQHVAKTLRFDTSTVVTHADPLGIVPSSATCKFVTSGGKDAGLTGSVSLPSVDTTVGLPALPATLSTGTAFNFNQGQGSPQTALAPESGHVTFAFGADSLTLTSPASTPHDGDQFNLARDSVNHTTTQVGTAPSATLLAGISASYSADPDYDAVVDGNTVVLTGKAPGAIMTTLVAATTSSNSTFTVDRTVTGQDATSGVPAVADQWTVQFGGSGGPVDGGTLTITIDGTPYTATYHSPDDGSLLFADLIAAIATDPNYTASADMGSGGGPSIIVTANAAGVRSSVVSGSTNFPGVTFTSTQTRPGVDLQTGSPATTDQWTATLTVTGNAAPSFITTNDYFAGAWMKAGTEYRKIATQTYTSYPDTSWSLAFAFDIAASAPFASWQVAQPSDTTSVSLYQNASVVHGVSPPSASTKSVVRVVAPTGVAVGDPYLIVSDGVPVVVTATRVAGHSVTISPSLDSVPSDGSTFQALKMTVTVDAPTKTLLGTSHKMVWEYTDGTTNRQHVESVSVVRWVPDPPITPEGVKSLLAAYQQSTANARDQTYYQGIADRVTAKIEQALMGAGRRQSCFGDPNAFSEPGRTSARLFLADDGFYPSGAQPDAYLRECQMRLQQEMVVAIAGLGYDTDGDGALTGDEKRPKFFSFKVTL